jgi:DNA-binding transcriptional ArsR family regulator
MGTSKTNLFTTDQNTLVKWTKAMGHPARIAILQHLAKQSTCVNNDLVGELGLAQATVSQHLKALKEAGLLSGTVEGTKVCYCLDNENWKKIEQGLQGFFHELNACTDNCC